jgi:hypothetical protein
MWVVSYISDESNDGILAVFAHGLLPAIMRHRSNDAAHPIESQAPRCLAYIVAGDDHHIAVEFSAARSESCARRCGHAVHFGHEANDPVRFVQHRCECAAKQRAAARRRSTSSLTLPRSNTRITCKCELALVNNCVGFRTTSLFSCFEISWLRS